MFAIFSILFVSLFLLFFIFKKLKQIIKKEGINHWIFNWIFLSPMSILTILLVNVLLLVIQLFPELIYDVLLFLNKHGFNLLEITQNIRLIFNIFNIMFSIGLTITIPTLFMCFIIICKNVVRNLSFLSVFLITYGVSWGLAYSLIYTTLEAFIQVNSPELLRLFKEITVDRSQFIWDLFLKKSIFIYHIFGNIQCVVIIIIWLLIFLIIKKVKKCPNVPT